MSPRPLILLAFLLSGCREAPVSSARWYRHGDLMPFDGTAIFVGASKGCVMVADSIEYVETPFHGKAVQAVHVIGTYYYGRPGVSFLASCTRPYLRNHDVLVLATDDAGGALIQLVRRE